MTDAPTFTMTRRFSASRQRVWTCFTDPALLSRWYGPGVETVIHGFDLRPGGHWRNEMKMRSMSDYSQMTFAEVEPPARLSWQQMSTDADWQPAANPMMPDWPRVFYIAITLAEAGAETEVTLTMTPQDATEAELQCFAQAMGNMQNGWGSGFAEIDTILAEPPA
ncbi:SRPBCC family protein [Algicella marina]|uniref:SRPBCC domain-containing protein n=1 Tax=Algicella marina TaxID=2683284 RepID=A0A6P1T1Z4_9RHOB|nr:SRPBCC domain-containing protein [Algicella marina]QHQ36944.1 SRPBCC domain-containing protein [Algicella marina]